MPDSTEDWPPVGAAELRASGFVLDGSAEHRSMVEVRVLRDLARRCHNGAPDPYQEFYDLGMSPLLDRLADAIERPVTSPADPKEASDG